MNERQRRAVERLRDDQAVIRAAAALLRDPDARDRWAGLSDPDTAELLAGLLDRTADALTTVTEPVRHVAVQACRDLTGDRMDRPTVRRTRRR